jgi:two-component system, cell cycle sensor histidine kinase and response regulator CckA
MWSVDTSGVPRVLVVDDEPGIRALANRALRNAGYDVTTAADGIEGLDVDERQPEPFDVFVLDVRMPNMTGDELAQQLRRRHPDCKVLYFTGFADQLVNSKPVLCGNEAFIEKPAQPTALLEAVSLLLYGHTLGPR